jgi:salicylate hydroxylase
MANGVTGVNSTARRTVQGGADHPPQRTGFAAYRAVVDIDRMLCDPDIAWLLEKPSFNLCYIATVGLIEAASNHCKAR